MSELVMRGVELAIFGMGTVFVFLTLLVLATMAMSALVGRYSPEPAPSPAARSEESTDAATMAAIAAAVRAWRARHRVDR